MAQYFGKWQAFVDKIRTVLWDEQADIAARVLSLRLVGALPLETRNGAVDGR